MVRALSTLMLALAAAGIVVPPAARAVERIGVTAGTSALDVCGGDCNGDLHVSVSELIQGVNIALERAPATNCVAVDGNADGRVTVAEIVRAVGNALGVCPCPFDFTAPSLDAGIACVYAGRWNDLCGDAALQATFAGDGSSVGVALIAGGAGDPITFLSVVRSAGEATLAGYMTGETAQTLTGGVTLSADRRELRVEPDEPTDLVVRDCPFTGYSGRLVDIVKLR